MYTVVQQGPEINIGSFAIVESTPGLDSIGLITELSSSYQSFQGLPRRLAHPSVDVAPDRTVSSPPPSTHT